MVCLYLQPTWTPPGVPTYLFLRVRRRLLTSTLQIGGSFCVSPAVVLLWRLFVFNAETYATNATSARGSVYRSVLSGPYPRIFSWEGTY
jgi:hypothetical protein